MTFIVFGIILSVLILIHELGHYLVAKKNGIRVEEFGLGLPPRIFGKKIGETIYSLNWLPFGGFVKLTGEDILEQDATANDPRSFAHKSVWQRAAVLVAGVTMNFLLTITLYYLLLSFNGFKSPNMPLIYDYKFPFGNEVSYNTVITGLSPESSLVDKNVSAGDLIESINGEAVTDISDVRRLVSDKAGTDVEIVLSNPRMSEKGERTITAVPTTDDEGKGILGVYLGKSVTLGYTSPVQRLFGGILHSYNMLAYSVYVFGELISSSFQMGSISPVSEGVSGPVGIYSVVGSILDSGEGVWWTLVDFVALMSLSLAFLNIMPFPALDGGRLAFVLLEKLRGRRINPNTEANVHKWGMIVLLALILLVSIKDVVKFF